MPRRKGSEDECDIDDALQQSFYHEPVWSGKKRKRPHYERVTLPKPGHRKSGPSQLQLQDPGLPSSSLDNPVFHDLEQEMVGPREKLPVKGKVCLGLFFVHAVRDQQ